MDITNSINLREKTLAIFQPYAKFTNVFCYTVLHVFSYTNPKYLNFSNTPSSPLVQFSDCKQAMLYINHLTLQNLAVQVSARASEPSSAMQVLCNCMQLCPILNILWKHRVATCQFTYREYF